jgi:hypothetical protein
VCVLVCHYLLHLHSRREQIWNKDLGGGGGGLHGVEGLLLRARDRALERVKLWDMRPWKGKGQQQMGPYIGHRQKTASMTKLRNHITLKMTT